MEELFRINRIGGNLLGSGSRISWREEQIDYIVKHYNQNHNVKELANLFSTSQASMRSLLHKQGINTILTCDKEKILHPRNSDYFEIIDSPDKAYWLGFLYADGYVNKKKHQLRINLQKKDEEHLQKFLKALGATNTSVKYTTKKMDGKIYEGAYIAFGDKKMVDDLINKGCIQSKSLVIKFPTEDIVPEHLLSHFIRGVYDGDGTITYQTHSITKLKYFSMGILGTEDLLQGIQKFLGKINLKLEDKNTHYVLRITGNRVVFNSLSILYKDSYEDIELTRKREKYELLVEQRCTVKTYSTSDVQKEVS